MSKYKSLVCALVVSAFLPACGDSGGSKVKAEEDAGADKDPTVDSGIGSEEPDAGKEDAGQPVPALTDDELRQRSDAKFRSCKIVGKGEYSGLRIQDDFDRCVANCTAASNCSDLKALWCSQDSDTAFGRCFQACPQMPLDGFACQGAAKIPKLFVCDGASDCPSGDDELNCEEFKCTDGSTISVANPRCDGLPECTDGSDEDGCASYCQ